MIDSNEEAILEQIRRRAGSYVPEWRFDSDKPDIGTALALVCAGMYAGMRRKLAGVPGKNRINFLNALGADLLPALPSEGYAAFSLVNGDAKGVEVPVGTILNASSAQTESGTVSFRTLDEVFVTPSELQEIYQVDDRYDSIRCLYSAVGETAEDETESSSLEDLTLFNPELLAGQRGNLQRHEMVLCHREVLHIRESGTVTLHFLLPGDRSVSEEILRMLCDPELVAIEYLSEEGFCPFDGIRQEGKTLVLCKTERQPELSLREWRGENSCFLRICARKPEQLKEFTFEKIKLGSQGQKIAPEAIYAAGVECGSGPYFPFGERLSAYSEIYFGSSEVLGKKGADVELSFHLEFAKIPFDYVGEQDQIKWEWIMKKSDLKTDPEYDSTVEAVLWEYYNGTGWARLFSDHAFEGLFMPDEDAGGKRTVRFVCPQNMEVLTVEARECIYIRARILKINNLYKQKGFYISPILDQTYFSYSYENHPVSPESLSLYNNLEWTRYSLSVSGMHSMYRPFSGMKRQHRTLYLGFDRPFSGAPIRLLCLFRNSAFRGNAVLLWEYYNGKEWRTADLTDETEQFSHSGLITLTGHSDSVSQRLFGKERYWLRLTDATDAYEQRGIGKEQAASNPPVLQGMYLNASRILQVDKSSVVYYRMETYRENKELVLPERRLLGAYVYIDETNRLSEQECTVLRKRGALFSFSDEAKLWVRWSCVPDFFNSGPKDRHFRLDRNEGSIQFGDGRRGMIPPASRTDNIRVEYFQGGGTFGNVDRGEVNQLDQELGFINRVTNPGALAGGSEIETLDQAVQRNTAAIRHRGRAVTIRDFEDLALSSSRQLCRVRCFAGYDGSGASVPGAVTLVAVQEAGRSGSPFEPIREQIGKCLRERMSGELREQETLFIREPDYVQLDIRVEIAISGFSIGFRVKRLVQECLRDFLDPITGNFNKKGWEIGTLPEIIQLKNAVAAIPGVLYVRNLYLTAYIGQDGITDAPEYTGYSDAEGRIGGRKETDLEQMRKNPYVLPVSGIHEVLMIAARES